MAKVELRNSNALALIGCWLRLPATLRQTSSLQIRLYSPTGSRPAICLRSAASFTTSQVVSW
jgi:hypothetical protein